MTTKERYQEYLSRPGAPLKIPYIECVKELSDKIPVTYSTTSDPNKPLDPHPYAEVLRDLNLKALHKTREKAIQSYQRALTIRKYGRLRGNMEYLEDSWDIQIQPITIKYAHLRGSTLSFTEPIQSKVRDKFLKVRVRYDGSQYVIVNGIRTYYRISYA